jgi:hypothetical protein
MSFTVLKTEKRHTMGRAENLPYRDEAKDNAGSTNHRDNITV